MCHRKPETQVYTSKGGVIGVIGVIPLYLILEKWVNIGWFKAVRVKVELRCEIPMTPMTPRKNTQLNYQPAKGLVRVIGKSISYDTGKTGEQCQD